MSSREAVPATPDFPENPDLVVIDANGYEPPEPIIETNENSEPAGGAGGEAGYPAPAGGVRPKQG